MHTTRNTCNLPCMTMTIGQRIAHARSQAGLNQSELAAKLSLSPQSVQQWERDKTTPRRSRIEAVSSLLGVSPEWLLFGYGSPENTQSRPTTTNKVTGVVTNSPDSAMVIVPFFAPMDTGESEAMQTMDQVEKKIRIDNATLAPFNVQPQHVRAAAVTSDEMAPRLLKGDTVLIDTSDTSPQHGKLYAFAAESELRIRRSIQQLDGTWLITSDNPGSLTFIEEIISEEHFKRLNVVGRVFMVMGGV